MQRLHVRVHESQHKILKSMARRCNERTIAAVVREYLPVILDRVDIGRELLETQNASGLNDSALARQYGGVYFPRSKNPYLLINQVLKVCRRADAKAIHAWRDEEMTWNQLCNKYGIETR